MTIGKLSEDGAQYWAWRFNMKAELIQHTPFETEPGRLFVEELETGNFDELGHELPSVLMAIDAKLYGALLTSIQHLPTLMMKVSTNARQGCGRQVVKVIDSEYNFEAAKLAELGNEQISNGVCKSMSGISDYVARTRLAFQYLEGFPGAMPPESMV